MMQSVHLGQSKLKTNNEVIASEVTVNENTIRKRDRQADNQTDTQAEREIQEDLKEIASIIIGSWWKVKGSKSRSEGRWDGNNSTR